MTNARTGPVVRTVAVRVECPSSAISPKKSPVAVEEHVEVVADDALARQLAARRERLLVPDPGDRVGLVARAAFEERQLSDRVRVA